VQIRLQKTCLKHIYLSIISIYLDKTYLIIDMLLPEYKNRQDMARFFLVICQHIAPEMLTRYAYLQMLRGPTNTNPEVMTHPLNIHHNKVYYQPSETDVRAASLCLFSFFTISLPGFCLENEVKSFRAPGLGQMLTWDFFLVKSYSVQVWGRPT
jgi:hypothetical protein